MLFFFIFFFFFFFGAYHTRKQAVPSAGGADCCCLRQHPSGVVTLGDNAKPNKKSKTFLPIVEVPVEDKFGYEVRT